MTLDQAFIASAREAFREDGTVLAGVRPETIAAWRRSKAAGASATGALRLVRDEPVGENSSLLRAVRPLVLERIGELETTDVAMMLIDREARIVGRWESSPVMTEILDQQSVHVGTVFDEPSVGSTGLGTALEHRRPTVVNGTEHYNDSFDDVVAVGVPLIHPGSGVVEGVIDLVCPVGAPVEMMLAIISSTAREASDRLVSGYARDDRELLDAFLQSERRGPRRPVFALNDRMMISNTKADHLLVDLPHTTLWKRVHDAMLSGEEYIDLAARPGGHLMRGRLRSLMTGGDAVGAVVQVERTRERTRPPADTDVQLQLERFVAQLRERLAGDSGPWNVAVRAVAGAAVNRDRLLVVGESGVGKSVLARVAAEVVDDGGSPLVVDADSLPAMDAGAATSIVIEGLDLLDARGRARLANWLEKVAKPQSFVVGTARGLSGDEDGHFDHVVTIPTLAQRPDDIRALAVTWARDIATVDIAPDAFDELTRRVWPGNVSQLFRVLESAAARHGDQAGPISARSLPKARHDRRAARRLTYLERVERDAIAALLDAHNGNKQDVAHVLGLSRSTLYRKLAALGLDG